MPIESYLLWERVGKIVVALPAVHETLCHDTPAFYVEKKLFVRLKEDGQTIAIYNENRDHWLAMDSDAFFITDHYKNYPMFLVDLKRVSHDHLQELLVTAWKMRAPKKWLKVYSAS